MNISEGWFTRNEYMDLNVDMMDNIRYNPSRTIHREQYYILTWHMAQTA